MADTYNVNFYYDGIFGYDVANNWNATGTSIEALDTSYGFTEALSVDGNRTYSTMDLAINLTNTQFQTFIQNPNLLGVEVRKNSSIYFRGYIRPNASFSIYEDLRTFSVQVQDLSILLDRTLEEDVVFTNVKLCDNTDVGNSLFHKILGLYTDVDFSLSTTVYNDTLFEAFKIKSGESISDVFTKLCEEYGYAWKTNNIYNTIEISNAYPDTVTTGQIFNNDNIIQPLNVSKTDNEESGVVLKWSNLTTETNQLVYRDIKDAESKKGVYANLYYPAGSNEKDIFQKFRLIDEDVDLIHSSNHILDYSADEGIALVSSSYEPTQAKVVFQNTTGGLLYINKFDIRADVIIRHEENETKIVPTSPRYEPEEYSADYVYDEDNAERLANIIFNRQTVRTYDFSFISRTSFNIGSFATLQDTKTGLTTTVFITSKAINQTHNDLYEYHCVSAGNITFQTTSLSTRSFRTTSLSGTLDVEEQIVSVEDRLDEVEATTAGQSTDLADLTARIGTAEGDIVNQGLELASQAEDILANAGSIGTISIDLTGLTSTVGSHTTDISGLTTDLTGLSSTVGSHTTAIGGLQTTVGSHSTSISSLITDLGNAETSISVNAGNITSLASDISTIDGTVTTQGTAISQNSTDITAVALRVTDTETGITTNATAISQNADEITSLATSVSTIDGTVSSHGTSISQNSSSITTLAGRVTTAEGTITTHGTSISQNADEISSLSISISTIDGNVTTNATSISQNSSSITTLAGRVTTAEGTITTHGTSITQNADEITSLATSVSTIDGTITSQGTAISQNATDITSLATRVDTAEGTITSHTTSINQNATDISTNATAITTVEGNVSTNATSISQNADSITSLATSVSTLDGTVTSQGTSISQNATNITSLALRVTDTETGISTNATSISQNADEITSLATSVSTIEGDVSTNTTSISQNADEITSLATSVSTIDGIVSSHGTSISQNSTDISTLATRVTDTETGISTNATSITQNADEITSLATRVTAVDGVGGVLETHASSISQNADNIGLRVEAVDTSGNSITGAKLEVGVVDGASYIMLDADKILIDGSIKAQKIDTDDLMTKELVIKDGGLIRTENNNVRIESDGSITAVNASLVGGTFTGSVQHSSFETVVESSPSSPISIPSKTRWRADYLYDVLTGISVGTTLKTATGSYNGSTVDAATRLDATNRLTLVSASTGGVEELYSYELVATITVPNDTDRLYYWWDIDHANSSGYVFITKNTTSTTSRWVEWNTSNYPAGTHNIISGYRTDFAAGDVLRFYTYRTTLYGTNFQIHSAPYDKGTILRTSDTSLHWFRDEGYYTTPVSISSPNSYTSSIDYVLISSIASQFNAYASGSTYKASGTLVDIGSPRTVTNVMRNGSNITFYYTSGEPTILTANDTLGATTGSYNISGSVQVVEQEAGILVKSITPMVNATSSTTTGGTDIGNGSYKIRNITGAGNITGFANVSATTINSSGTSNVVYGAVFN